MEIDPSGSIQEMLETGEFSPLQLGPLLALSCSSQTSLITTFLVLCGFEQLTITVPWGL